MTIIFNLLNLFIQAVDLYSMILVIYALLSWMPGGYESGIGRFLAKICEPFLNLFRKLPLTFGPVDFSIMAAVLVLNLGGRLIYQLLWNLAVRVLYGG